MMRAEGNHPTPIRTTMLDFHRTITLPSWTKDSFSREAHNAQIYFVKSEVTQGVPGFVLTDQSVSLWILSLFGSHFSASDTPRNLSFSTTKNCNLRSDMHCVLKALLVSLRSPFFLASTLCTTLATHDTLAHSTLHLVSPQPSVKSILHHLHHPIHHHTHHSHSQNASLDRRYPPRRLCPRRPSEGISNGSLGGGRGLHHLDKWDCARGRKPHRRREYCLLPSSRACTCTDHNQLERRKKEPTFSVSTHCSPTPSLLSPPLTSAKRHERFASKAWRLARAPDSETPHPH